jgi:branched-chain amino acid aminotransferase
VIFFVDGRYLPQEEARVSVLDRGFLFGDSVYETVRAYRGRVLFWSEHAARLKRSAFLLGIETEWDRVAPIAVLHELLRRNEVAEARIRIVVTRGEGVAHRLGGSHPTWVVTIEPFIPPSDAEYDEGISAVLVSIVRHGASCQNPEIKSSNLLNNVLARREALERGADEGILANPKGFIAEGAHSNIFWVAPDGVLCTPSRDVGILPGITRQKLITIARAGGMRVTEVEEGAEACDRAREIFLTSTSWEALSVSRWNGRPVGDGKGGCLARELRGALRKLYDESEETA